MLGTHTPATTLTRSELEERFLALCMEAALPLPELNVPIALPDGGMAVVDALWRTRRLIVETDGRATHLTRSAFEHDRWRDAQLLRAGFAVVRLTWHQVTREASAVKSTLGELLTA